MRVDSAAARQIVLVVQKLISSDGLLREQQDLLLDSTNHISVRHAVRQELSRKQNRVEL